jgi:hypothetical protein
MLQPTQAAAAVLDTDLQHLEGVVGFGRPVVYGIKTWRSSGRTMSKNS